MVLDSLMTDSIFVAYLRLRSVTARVWSGVRASFDFMNSVGNQARSAGVVSRSLSP